MSSVSGLLAKIGAEAVYAAALPDGRALAFKIDDGAKRAVPVVLAEALRRLDVAASEVAGFGTVPLYGGGRPVASCARPSADRRPSPGLRARGGRGTGTTRGLTRESVSGLLLI